MLRVPLCLPLLTRGTEVLVLALQGCPGDDTAVGTRVRSGPREHSVSGQFFVAVIVVWVAIVVLGTQPTKMKSTQAI